MTLLKSTRFDSIPSPSDMTNVGTLSPADAEQITSFSVLPSSAAGTRALSHRTVAGTDRHCHLCVPAPIGAGRLQHFLYDMRKAEENYNKNRKASHKLWIW